MQEIQEVLGSALKIINKSNLAVATAIPLKRCQLGLNGLHRACQLAIAG